MLQLRPALWPQDVSSVDALDTSFVTDKVYRLAQEGLTFCLLEEDVSPPLSKRYTLDCHDAEARAEWDYAIVAQAGGRAVGFVAAQYVAWNRRVNIWHLYVAPDYRGRGLGTQLIDSVEGFARAAGARCLWLETQNVNFPAVSFYLHAGFTLCGLDASLYDPDSLAQAETALFMTRPVSTQSKLDG